MENIIKNILKSIAVGNDTLDVLQQQNQQTINIKKNVEQQKHSIEKSSYYVYYLDNWFLNFFKKKTIQTLIENKDKQIPQNIQEKQIPQHIQDKDIDDISFHLKHLYNICIMQKNEINNSTINNSKIDEIINTNIDDITKLKNTCDNIFKK